MPLVLSPESSCDICFSTYTDDLRPHVVSCGHAFCKPCLSTHFQIVSDKTRCPTCRKSFSIPADSNLPHEKRIEKVVKKLIVDFPKDTDQTLLADVALSLRLSPSDDMILELDSRFLQWIASHPDDNQTVVREVHEAFRRYHGDAARQKLRVIEGLLPQILEKVNVLDRTFEHSRRVGHKLDTTIIAVDDTLQASTIDLPSDASNRQVHDYSTLLDQDVALVDIPSTARNERRGPPRLSSLFPPSADFEGESSHGLSIQVVPPTTPSPPPPDISIVQEAARLTRRQSFGTSLRLLFDSETSTPQTSPLSAHSSLRLDHSRYTSPEPISPSSPGHNLLHALSQHSLNRQTSTSSLLSAASWHSQSTDASFRGMFSPRFQTAMNAFDREANELASDEVDGLADAGSDFIVPATVLYSRRPNGSDTDSSSSRERGAGPDMLELFIPPVPALHRRSSSDAVSQDTRVGGQRPDLLAPAQQSARVLHRRASSDAGSLSSAESYGSYDGGTASVLPPFSHMTDLLRPSPPSTRQQYRRAPSEAGSSSSAENYGFYEGGTSVAPPFSYVPDLTDLLTPPPTSTSTRRTHRRTTSDTGSGPSAENHRSEDGGTMTRLPPTPSLQVSPEVAPSGLPAIIED